VNNSAYCSWAAADVRKLDNFNYVLNSLIEYPEKLNEMRKNLDRIFKGGSQWFPPFSLIYDNLIRYTSYHHSLPQKVPQVFFLIAYILIQEKPYLS
jgi:hypothetical protein